MPSRLDIVEENIGKCLADSSFAVRKVKALEAQQSELESKIRELTVSIRERAPQQSETNLSWRPLGLSVKLKNVAPWAFVAALSIVAIIIALLKR